MCLGRCLFASRSIPYTVQLDPVAGLWLWLSLSSCFSSPRLRVCRTVGLAGGGQGLVDGWLEAAHVLHGGTVCLYGLHVLVQDGKNLIVQDLVLPDSVCHFLQGLQRTGPCRLGVGREGTEIKGEQEEFSEGGVQGPDALMIM